METKGTYRTGKSARRVDSNQQQVIDALRAAGFNVTDTSGTGRGFCDLIAIDPAGRVYLIEVKAEMKFTKHEIDFMAHLVNDVYRVICSPEQVANHLRIGE